MGTTFCVHGAAEVTFLLNEQRPGAVTGSGDCRRAACRVTTADVIPLYRVFGHLSILGFPGRHQRSQFLPHKSLTINPLYSILASRSSSFSSINSAQPGLGHPRRAISNLITAPKRTQPVTQRLRQDVDPFSLDHLADDPTGMPLTLEKGSERSHLIRWDRDQQTA